MMKGNVWDPADRKAEKELMESVRYVKSHF
jgi:hypothetical protein